MARIPIKVRAATREDFAAMAALAADAFNDDDVFGRFMHPHRREYWDDYVAWWKALLESSVEEGHALVVAEDKGTVVGWANWNEMDLREGEKGAGDSKDAPAAAPPSGQEKPVFRCADTSNIASFDAAKPLTDHLWSGTFVRTYNLEALCVAPAAQGRGFGAALVRWGTNKADREMEVPSSVIAAFGKDPFYARYGFKERGRADVGPLAGKVVGGAVMFRERVVGL